MNQIVYKYKNDCCVSRISLGRNKRQDWESLLLFLYTGIIDLTVRRS